MTTIAPGYLAFGGVSRRAVLRYASTAFDVDMDELTGPSRARPLVVYRQVTYATMRSFGWSFPLIGQVVRRDWSTVQHGCEVVERNANLRAVRDRLVADIRTAYEAGE